MQMLTTAREYTLALATFANKLETCNGKLKGLCQNPQGLCQNPHKTQPAVERPAASGPNGCEYANIDLMVIGLAVRHRRRQPQLRSMQFDHCGCCLTRTRCRTASYFMPKDEWFSFGPSHDTPFLSGNDL